MQAGLHNGSMRLGPHCHGISRLTAGCEPCQLKMLFCVLPAHFSATSTLHCSVRQGVSWAGILASPEAWWFEAGWLEDVFIQGNTLRQCGWMARDGADAGGGILVSSTPTCAFILDRPVHQL